jgi:hypothetical protein
MVQVKGSRFVVCGLWFVFYPLNMPGNLLFFLQNLIPVACTIENHSNKKFPYIETSY